MPELPEVESVRRAIAPALEGRRSTAVEIYDVRLTRPEDPLVVAAELTGERVERVDRRGKYLIVRFASGRALLIHLRMTGSLLRDPSGQTHVRAVLSLDDGSEVGYRDVRRFGTWLLLEPGELEPYLGERLGEEPLVAAFTAKGLGERLARAGARRSRPRCSTSARSRAREHLRRRGALARAAPSAPPGRLARPERAAPPSHRDPQGARARDRPAGLDALGLPAPGRLVRLDAEGVPRLRPHRRALRPLRHAVREDPRRRPRHLVLPALPASGMTVHVVFETHSLSVDNERGIATGWLDGTLSEEGAAWPRSWESADAARSTPSSPRTSAARSRRRSGPSAARRFRPTEMPGCGSATTAS